MLPIRLGRRCSAKWPGWSGAFDGLISLGWNYHEMDGKHRCLGTWIEFEN
jgi:hypothetical protein